ncbi:hypothetical protein SIM97_18990 [Pectobacterium zantedeschiae]
MMRLSGFAGTVLLPLTRPDGAEPLPALALMAIALSDRPPTVPRPEADHFSFNPDRTESY